MASSAHKIQSTVVPFRTSAVFCSNCGMMLTLESHSSSAECRFCKQITSVAALLGNEVVTKKELNQRKDWMEMTAPVGQKVEKTIMSEDCPAEGCDSTQMYYFTRQMRSADEGQTVFYECVKCGHKFTVNT
jgi:DNA-directed RNA polymerase I subunit RPA12